MRFRDVREQPEYYAHHHVDEWTHRSPALEDRDAFAARLAGQPVAIVLPPVAPHSHWECGVERVWQLPDEEVIRFTGEPPRTGHVYVCEHQVEVD